MSTNSDEKSLEEAYRIVSQSNVMDILKSIICTPCTDDFTHIRYFYSEFGFCAVFTILRTNQMKKKNILECDDRLKCLRVCVYEYV